MRAREPELRKEKKESNLAGSNRTEFKQQNLAKIAKNLNKRYQEPNREHN